MKIYVDKIPSECAVCPCCETGGTMPRDNDHIYCKLLKQGLIKRGNRKLKDCPLKLLADHDKQVRNEFINELKNSFTFKLATELDFKLNHSQTTNKECYDRIMRTKENLDKMLDKLKGENNAENSD